MNRFHGYLLTCVILISFCGAMVDAVPMLYGPSMYTIGGNFRRNKWPYKPFPHTSTQDKNWGVGARWFGSKRGDHGHEQ